MVDPIIGKVWMVHAPDVPGPSRVGHGACVITTAPDAENAIIQAPLHVFSGETGHECYAERDLYDWREDHVQAKELHMVGARVLANGRVRVTFEM